MDTVEIELGPEASNQDNTIAAIAAIIASSTTIATKEAGDEGSQVIWAERRTAASIFWFFTVSGLIVGNWAACLPTIKANFELSDMTLGLVFLTAIAGAITGVIMASKIIPRIGSKYCILIGSTLQVGLSFLLSAKKQVGLLVAALFFLGMGQGWMDVCSNTQGVLFEKRTGKHNLGNFFAGSSVGAVVGALGAGSILQSGLGLLWDIGIFASFGLVVNLIAINFLYDKETEDVEHLKQAQDAEEVDSSAAEPKKRVERTITKSTNISAEDESANDNDSEPGASSYNLLESAEAVEMKEMKEVADELAAMEAGLTAADLGLPEAPQGSQGPDKPAEKVRGAGIAVAALCLVRALAHFGEGSVTDWSAIFLHTELHQNTLCSAMGIMAFQLFLIISRLSTATLLHHLSAARLIQLSGLVTFAGLGLVALSPALSAAPFGPAVAGFALAGAGLGTVSPLALSLAGKLKDSRSAVATVSMTSYLGFLVGPPLLGFLSVALHGLRFSFLVDGGLMLLISVSTTVASLLSLI